MRMVGESLGSYIRRRRLDWAADELASGQRRIIEVALDAGYDSQEAFTRAFERRYGRTPGEYRRVGRPRVLRPQLSVQPHDKWAGRIRLIMVWHVRLNKEPALRERRIWTEAIGAIIGVGAGRGIALVFMFTGLFNIIVVGVFAWRLPLKRLDA